MSEPGQARPVRGFDAAWVAQVTGGRLRQAGAGPAGAVSTDSRRLAPDDLFVALRGERMDGHAFVPPAIAGGAAGLLVADGFAGEVPEHVFVVEVDDPTRALLALGTAHRRELAPIPVVGVTGSCGKTTTKDMLARLLGLAMPTVAAERSFNNQIGVPLTLLRMQASTGAAVVELGTNAPGEIEMLCAAAQPDVGIVTCVAPAHLERLGSLEGVAQEKAALVRALPRRGLAVLNGDDPFVTAMAAQTAAEVRFVRLGREADCFAADLEVEPGGVRFLLDGRIPVVMPRLARHHVTDALLALVAAEWLGVPREHAVELLGRLEPSPRRLERHVAAGVTLLDDTYNMNPTSARAALQALTDLQVSGRRVVVFGGMLELGADSGRQHEELGAAVVRHEPDVLLAVGAEAAQIAAGAQSAGLPARRIATAAGLDDAQRALLGYLQPGDAVLLKASRRFGLDRLTERLLAALRAGPQVATQEYAG